MLKYAVYERNLQSMFMKIFFSNKYYQNITHLDRTGTKEYMIDSIAKSLWVAQKLSGNPSIELIEPKFVSESDVLRVHAKEYIDALRNSKPTDLANSSGLRWVPELFEASLSSVSGLYRAIETALDERVSGTLSTNFHHAKKQRGSGFCVLNGVAISVLKALRELGLKRILILDCDFHYGDGTAQLLRNIDGVHIYDIYGSFHNGSGGVTNAGNVTNTRVKDPSGYAGTLESFKNFASDYKPDLIIYDAGMDAFEEDRLCGTKGIDQDFLLKRDKLVFEFTQNNKIPIAFMLGGGYVKYVDSKGIALQKSEVEANRSKLVNLYLNTIRVASQTADSSR